MGTISHLSSLRAKAKRLGLGEASFLIALAVERGCWHYRPYAEAIGAKAPAVERADLSDEELSIALLLGSWVYNPVMIRVAAQLMAGPDTRSSLLLRLAVRERCEGVLGYIARQGAETEPANGFWKRLLDGLHEPDGFRSGVLPHRSRFRSETGMANPKRPGLPKVQWLRPSEQP